MATWLNHVAISAPRNGTTSHTVSPSSGTVVSGTLFTPTAGRLLVAVCEGAVTFSTPSGWTLPSGGSAVNNAGLYVFTRTAAGSDSLTTTHNGSNYTVIVDFYEFAEGSSFAGSASAIAVSNGVASPTLSGLTGSNSLMGAAGQYNSSSGTVSAVWNAGTEVVDASAPSSGTDGYVYSLTETIDSTATSVSRSVTTSGGLASSEKLMFAVKVSAGGGAVSLVPVDSAHVHVTESPTLTQVHAVVPSDTTHAHAADSPTLTQTHTLAPADSAHAHTTDAATIVQVHALAPGDSAHGHAADTPTLTQAHALTPADTAHGHTADSPALTQSGDLTPADTLHGHGVESPALTQAHILTPAESTHGHANESPTLTTGTTLQPADSSHGSTTDTPTLTQAHELAPADCTHAHTTEAPALTQVHILEPGDTLHTHVADSPLVFIPSGLPPPAANTVVTPAEVRILTVAAETRIITTPTETRIITD